jgi:hypothetical protein
MLKSLLKIATDGVEIAVKVVDTAVVKPIAAAMAVL